MQNTSNNNALPATNHSTLLPEGFSWQLQIKVPSQHAEDIAALLIDEGGEGAQLTDNDSLVLVGFVSDWQQADIRELALGICEIFEFTPTFLQIVQIPKKEWYKRWQQYFKPIKVGQHIWIVPTWEKTFIPPIGSTVVTIDPGMAFGTGQHATTTLCIRAIEKWAQQLQTNARQPQQVLDLGCGSGILAIVAAKLAADHVTALDNDPEAIDAAKENIALNQLQHKITLQEGTLSKTPECSYNLVLANILANTLEEMAESLVQATAPRGILVLSGILQDQVTSVSRAFLKAQRKLARPEQPAEVWLSGTWAAMIYGLS